MGKPIEFKTLCKTKDGRDLDMILREVFLKEEESKEIGFIGYLLDITELRKREEELRESRQLYYELVEGVNSIVLRMDGEGRLLSSIGLQKNYSATPDTRSSGGILWGPLFQKLNPLAGI
jgi:hypothetical protein